MKKFEAGDKVKRIKGSFRNTVCGGIYQVSSNFLNSLELEGHTNEEGEPTTFDASCFELYEEIT